MTLEEKKQLFIQKRQQLDQLQKEIRELRIEIMDEQSEYMDQEVVVIGGRRGRLVTDDVVDIFYPDPRDSLDDPQPVYRISKDRSDVQKVKRGRI
jgi:hypothetical protein